MGFTPSQEATVKTLAGRPERGANVTVTVLNHTAIDVRWVKPSKSASCFFISPSCVCIKMNFKRTDFWNDSNEKPSSLCFSFSKEVLSPPFHPWTFSSFFYSFRIGNVASVTPVNFDTSVHVLIFVVAITTLLIFSGVELVYDAVLVSGVQ